MAVEEKPKLTEEERKLHAEYINDLVSRGFCKMDPAGSNTTILFNRFDSSREGLSYIGNDFDSWLHGRECNISIPYIQKGLKHISGQIFVPDGPDYVVAPKSKRTFANTSQRYAPETESADVSPLVIEFFERLFPSAIERKTILQWIAHMIQFPGQRPSWHIMLPSESGVGKGFLCEYILDPLVIHTATVKNYKAMTGQFSSLLAKYTFILIDDAKAKSDASQTELKSILSEERTFVEQKFGDAGMVNTYSRMMLASNEDRPLILEKGERRWFVATKLKHRKDQEDTNQFLARLFEWLQLPGSLDKVYNWFMQTDLTGFHHKQCPDSAGLQKMIAMSSDPYAEGIKHWTESNPVFTYGELKTGLLLDQSLADMRNDRRLGHLIREAGFVTSRVRVDKKQMSLYHPADMPQDIARLQWESRPAFP